MITLKVNGVTHTVNITDTSTPLLWVLRDVIGLTGTKYGCGIEVCGACTVLLDGSSERSCQVPVSEAQGRTITTVEGLSADGKSHPLQKAWLQFQVPQCGFCQSGMLMAAAGGDGPNNVCVCGTYQRIRLAMNLVGASGNGN